MQSRDAKTLHDNQRFVLSCYSHCLQLLAALQVLLLRAEKALTDDTCSFREVEAVKHIGGPHRKRRHYSGTGASSSAKTALNRAPATPSVPANWTCRRGEGADNVEAECAAGGVVSGVGASANG